MRDPRPLPFHACLAIALVALVALGTSPAWSKPESISEQELEATQLPSGAATQTLFLNRCVGGCTLFPGQEDSRLNRSSIINSTRNLAAYPFGDASFTALTACVREVFRPYLIDVVVVDPGNSTHREHMVGGTPQQLGQPSNISGVAPYACPGIQNSISFTFAAFLGDDIASLCYTATHEIGHQFGLDHEFHAPDPMTYLAFPALRTFTRTDEPCGEGTARDCVCGTPQSQNTHALLDSRIGTNPVVFDNSFENDLRTPGALWNTYVSPWPLITVPQGTTCGTDPVRAILQSAPY